MAKSTKAASPCCGSNPASERRWEVEDALRTLTRAEEIKADKKLMGEVETHALEKAEELEEVAAKAKDFAKRGLISDKQAEKLKGRKAAA